MNENLIRIAQDLCSENNGMNCEEYANQLNILYGAIFEVGAFDAKIEEEIKEIEKGRIALYKEKICKVVTGPASLVSEYSTISFALAQKSLLNGSVYKIASILDEVISEFSKEGYLSPAEKENLKLLVSESILDFRYAAGNHEFSSFRMAPHIRANKK